MKFQLGCEFIKRDGLGARSAANRGMGRVLEEIAYLDAERITDTLE